MPMAPSPAVEAMRILKAIGAHPRRTIRVAIWSGEEVGFVGGKAYVEQHLADAASRDKVAVYLNNDPGAGATYGWYMANNSRRARRSSTPGSSRSRTWASSAT